jgi:hypothetical protein
MGQEPTDKSRHVIEQLGPIDWTRYPFDNSNRRGLTSIDTIPAPNNLVERAYPHAQLFGGCDTLDLVI